jgi:hypothetical protein
VVLDDPVVDNRHGPGLVGVGINVGGTSVGRPPRMPHAAGSRYGLPGDQVQQARELPLALAYVDPSAVQDGDTRRVVPAVLQFSQSGQQDLHALVRTGVTDDAAHYSGFLARVVRAMRIAGMRSIALPLALPRCRHFPGANF